jgi:hypothetical protein
MIYKSKSKDCRQNSNLYKANYNQNKNNYKLNKKW